MEDFAWFNKPESDSEEDSNHSDEDFLSDNDELMINPESRPVEFKSNKLKNNKLAVDGYLYTLNGSHKTSFYWNCDQYNYSKCSARLVTFKNSSGQHEIKKNSGHNHEPSSHRVLVEENKSKLREEAIKDTHGTPQHAVDKICNSESVRRNNLAPFMGSDASLRQVARRAKKSDADIKYPKSPTTLDFDFNMEFDDLYLDGEQILLFDMKYSNDTKRVTILTTDNLFKHFCDAELLVADATFKTCPKPYKQIFIIHGNVPGLDDYFTYPMIWIFMSGKEQEMYEIVFKELLDYATRLGFEIRANFLLCDFERAIRNAFQKFLPNATISACFFHTRQLVITRLKKLQLYKLYKKDPKFAFEITCIAALAYFPEDEIEEIFEQLEPTFEYAATKIFSAWFKKNYIRKPNGNLALNPPSFWSIHQITRLGFPKTQSGAEASHHSLFESCNKKPHLPLYKMITVLKQEMIKSERYLKKLHHGIPIKHRSDEHQQKEDDMQKILDNESQLPSYDVLMQVATVLCSAKHLLRLNQIYQTV